jgi:hypothetical protein
LSGPVSQQETLANSPFVDIALFSLLIWLIPHLPYVPTSGRDTIKKWWLPLCAAILLCVIRYIFDSLVKRSKNLLRSRLHGCGRVYFFTLNIGHFQNQGNKEWVTSRNVPLLKTMVWAPPVILTLEFDLK